MKINQPYRVSEDGHALYHLDAAVAMDSVGTYSPILSELVRRGNCHEPLIEALESALDRLERVDAMLLKATGSKHEGVDLGEATRGRAVLAEARAMQSESI